jgi:hypothetical protein
VIYKLLREPYAFYQGMEGVTHSTSELASSHIAEPAGMPATFLSEQVHIAGTF